ncbi:RNA polymerase II transcription factor B subunit 1 [Malassezia yamatoensis]|uniref:RNA polymerase II transcription factor B subunit 1 n=1 Tax=Malassezia yamatoensis TaxID=253288 RepID=A0AAJ5YUG8_9BASI|nr:RNA polymerase II transcription factor B subunit 1 [Malassezia yamatoensis]
MSDSSAAVYAAVSYKKVPGTLSLGPDGVLKWQPSSATATISAFEVQDAHLKGLKVSKPGAAQTALRLEADEHHSIHGEKAVMLTFNAETDIAVAAREKFKERLAAAIAKARASSDSTASPSVSRSQDQPLQLSETQLRGQVLLANPNLLALHKEVVGSGSIPDTDFWLHPTRAALLRAERAKMQQRQGRRAQLADPRPTQGDAGEMRINITPQLIRELFEQYPILTRAYNELVPEKLSENAFWTRYFQSKLYHRLRTSQRSAASEQNLADDPLFDPYLEEEDDQVEPRTQYNPHDALLNLEATAEDHAETGNVQDWTMRAGYDRRNLPLVRRFNNHASSLLRSSLGELSEKDARRVRRKVGGVDEEYPLDDSHIPHYDQIVMEDLNVHRSHVGRKLPIADQRAFFDQETNKEIDKNVVRLNAAESIEQFQTLLDAWRLDLAHFTPIGASMRQALDTMLENMEQQKQQNSILAFRELPAEIVKQVISCHAATNEFLQQFWQAVSPTSDAVMVHTLSLSQRVSKARQMLDVLRRTPHRMQTIMDAAEDAQPGSGSKCVQAAFDATQHAVLRALSYTQAT